MPQLNKKIEAFTISEMLVVLVISGIVISLSLVVLDLVQKQIQSISSHQEKQSEIRTLERELWQDFNKYDINYTKHKLYFLSEIDTVVYTFRQDYTLRNTDTLDVPVYEIKAYLDGEVTTKKYVDALELMLSKEQPDKTVFIHKRKDATYYMNDGL